MSTSGKFVSPRFKAWREDARQYLAAHIRPEHTAWESDITRNLNLQIELPRITQLTSQKVPPRFLSLAKEVICHRAPDAPALLYCALWRLTHGERHLFQLQHDPMVRKLKEYQKVIRREIHKAHAFVRFCRIELAQGVEHYVAWFEPEHPIVEPAVALFVERFTNMNWSVLSPWSCAHWQQQTLSFSAGIERSEFSVKDDLETLWRTYYCSIFNPARLKIAAMKKEMPVRYWKNLPESADIQTLVTEAAPRMHAIIGIKEEC